MNTEILTHLEESVQELFLPVAKGLMELKTPKDGDPNELLRNRFLCRGGAMILVGPTGIGKSSLAMQMAFNWCRGQEYFGITPARPLKILYIQAENDEGDLAEIRNGILDSSGLPDEDLEHLNINYITVLVDTHAGLEFCENVLKPLVKKYSPDLIIIDPALSYLGGETNNQQQVGAFLRGGLTPVLREFRCGLLLLHHTNKPPSGIQRPDWSAGDFAYLGSGSAEWANWPRAVIALRSLGSNEVFELRLGKRGGRLGWRDSAGAPLFSKLIRHSKTPGLIFWEEVSVEEAALFKAVEAKSKGKKPDLHPATVLSYVPEGGTETIAKIELKEALLREGYSNNGIRDKFALLLERGDLIVEKVSRTTGPAAIHFRRPTLGLVTNKHGGVSN